MFCFVLITTIDSYFCIVIYLLVDFKALPCAGQGRCALHSKNYYINKSPFRQGDYCINHRFLLCKIICFLQILSGKL